MKKRLAVILSAVLVFTMMVSGSVFAFSDVKGDPNEEDIMALHQSGVISGISNEHFAPKGKVTMAQAVALLVKGFHLNIDHIRFIKEPKASDYFTNIPDDAWYAQSFMIAQLNGLPLPKDADPHQNMTKEQFAHLLYSAISTTGDYAFIKMWVVLEDEKDVNPEYMNSIQLLLLGKIAELSDGRFYPKNELTRGEAAKLLNRAIRFVKEHKPVKPLPEKPNPSGEATMSVAKLTDDVNRVTLSWGEKPNPGYGISVSRIEFTDSGEARIYYKLHTPDPDKMYPQVITEAKTETFIASTYKPVLMHSGTIGGKPGSSTVPAPALEEGREPIRSRPAR